MELLQYDLKPLKITDRSIIDGILNSRETMLSAYTFATHYIWRDIFHFYWGIIDGYLCLFAQYDDYLYMPIPPVPCRDPASEGFQKIIPLVFSMMEKINKNKAISRIENIDPCQIESFISPGYDIRSGEPEYVYLRENLVTLKGNPYKAKRAMCNYFDKHYRYSYEPFQPSFADGCLRLYNEWRRERGKKIDDPFYRALLQDSSFAHKEAVRHYKSLRLTGRVVRINGRIEGYLFGFKRRGDILYILMEIANPAIKGLAQFIFREFCREMDGHTYINTLGDSGLGSLRRVKLSYRPSKVIPSYTAYQP